MATDPGAGLVQPPPVLTRISGTGASSLAYTLALGEEMLVEAIAVDADASAGGPSTLAVRYLAQSGETFAVSSTIAQLPAGAVGVVTFAPYLPDSSMLGQLGAESILQTGLASCELTGGVTVRIEAADSSVILTEARIWASNPGADASAQPPPLLPVYLLPQAGEVATELA